MGKRVSNKDEQYKMDNQQDQKVKEKKQKKFPFMLSIILIVAVALILLGIKGFTGLTILSDKQEITKTDIISNDLLDI